MATAGELTILLTARDDASKSLRTIGQDVARLEKQHGKAKAISILAARIARTAWLMLKRKEAFDATQFLK